MTRIALFLMLVLAIAVPSSVLASGVLVDVRGTVEVAPAGGAPRPGAVGIELPDGSSVTVGAGGAASVMLESGAIDTLAAGQRYTVGEKAPGGKRTTLSGGLAVAMRELAGADAKAESTVHAMLEKVGGPKIADVPAGFFGGLAAIFPQGTAVRLGPSLTFRWSASPAVDWPQPALVIDGAAGKHLATKPFPAGAHELSVGTASLLKKGVHYSWYLATQEGGLKGKTARFEFSVLSAAAEKELDAAVARIRSMNMSDEGKTLLIGQTEIGMGLNEEAAQVLVPLWEKTQAPFVKKLLRLAYARMSRPEAEKYKD